METQPIRFRRDGVRRDTTERLPVDTGQVRLRGARVPAFSARHLVADARSADAPAHPRLELIAECGRPAGDNHARSRLLGGCPFGRRGGRRRTEGLICCALSGRALRPAAAANPTWHNQTAEPALRRAAVRHRERIPSPESAVVGGAGPACDCPGAHDADRSCGGAALPWSDIGMETACVGGA